MNRCFDKNSEIETIETNFDIADSAGKALTRVSTEISEADNFAKFWSFSAISVEEFFKTSQ